MDAVDLRGVPPFALAPRYVPKPWGGRRLETVLGRTDLPAGPVGEAWDAGVLPHWDPVIVDGPLAGRSLGEVWDGPFPLLVKVLDAAEDLSVQVHPDGRDGVPAKEEAWLALASEGAVAVGAVTADVLPGPGAWLPELEQLPLEGANGARPPTIVHVPAGTVHAILGGALVWEVQTPVDVTWRLDDHGRVGLDGRPRDLHLDEAHVVLARGAPPAALAAPRAAGPGVRLVGERFTLEARPPGVWDAPRGVVCFLPKGGTATCASPAGAPVEVPLPPSRTLVLTPAVQRLGSSGWIFVAGPAGA